MYSFLHNGNISDNLSAEAIRLSTQSSHDINYAEPLQLHDDILHSLGE